MIFLLDCLLLDGLLRILFVLRLLRDFADCLPGDGLLSLPMGNLLDFEPSVRLSLLLILPDFPVFWVSAKMTLLFLDGLSLWVLADLSISNFFLSAFDSPSWSMVAKTRLVADLLKYVRFDGVFSFLS